MTQGTVALELDGPVARIRLNRPAVHNAMNLDWVRDLDAAARAAAASAARVVVIGGAGTGLLAWSSTWTCCVARGHAGRFFDAQERLPGARGGWTSS